jgi:hypothetical protein
MVRGPRLPLSYPPRVDRRGEQNLFVSAGVRGTILPVSPGK